MWYVDDNKNSHEDPDVVTAEVIYLMKKYSENMSVSTGNKHRLLGMSIEIAEDNNLIIDMKEHL